MRKPLKPHIYREAGVWLCRIVGYGVGKGRTPAIAYHAWALIDGFMRRAHRANWCAEEE